MSEKGYLDIFEENGIKPTAIRLLVLKTIMNYKDPFSLGDLENSLVTVDKSTLFRTITLFHEHNLIRSIEDGSGSLKYCCHQTGQCTLQELHCHFYCLQCHKTYCLDETPVPLVELPDKFTVQQINYMLKGVCPDCQQLNK